MSLVGCWNSPALTSLYDRLLADLHQLHRWKSCTVNWWENPMSHTRILRRIPYLQQLSQFTYAWGPAHNVPDCTLWGLISFRYSNEKHINKDKQAQQRHQ